MKKNRVILFFIFSLFPEISAITLMYNMRIRRSFALGASELNQKKKLNWIGSVVPVVYYRKRHIVDPVRGIDVRDKRQIAGSVFNLRYKSKNNWWVELSTGLEKERACLLGTSQFKTTRLGFDDVVIAAGYNKFFGDTIQTVIYGMAGFPTRKKLTTEEVHDTLVGTRFYSLGFGTEFSYSFINSLKQAAFILFQNRFLHFFDRRWFPILPCDAKIRPGNVTDLLFTLNYRYKKDIIEVGYNPSFFTNQGVLLSTGEVKAKPFIRNSVYATYAHLFVKMPVIQRPGFLGIGVSLAKGSEFETKVFSWWVNLSVIF